MSGKMIERLVASMLILFLLGYVVVQAARILGTPIKTETVYEYTVSQSVDAPGIIFREERVIPGSSAGIQSCLFDDGERVLIGQPVVEYLNSYEGGGNRNRLREVEWEIAMLEEAQNTTLSHFSNADALGRDLRQQLGYLVRMSSTGNYEQTYEVRPTLISLLNKRQIATGKESTFENRIGTLESERSELSVNSDRDIAAVVNAPISGYYAHPIDGLESVLTLEMARTADQNEFISLIETTMPPKDESAWGSGRIITSQNWYVAVKVNKYAVQWVKPGQALTMSFGSLASRVPAVVRRVLSSGDSDDAVLVIHCNFVSGDIINLRRVDVHLHFQQYTGLRVDTSKLRFVNGERGIFVLENNVVRFKRVDPIYEEQGFILSQPPVDPYDDITLCQYDQIITKGTDLEDGKIIE